MSSKYAEEYEAKLTVSCKICNGNYIPGGTKQPLPDHVCIWCFYRGSTYKRYMMFWAAMDYYRSTHEEDCRCTGCKIFLAATPIMNQSASIQVSEIKP